MVTWGWNCARMEKGDEQQWQTVEHKSHGNGGGKPAPSFEFVEQKRVAHPPQSLEEAGPVPDASTVRRHSLLTRRC